MPSLLICATGNVPVIIETLYGLRSCGACLNRTWTNLIKVFADARNCTKPQPIVRSCTHLGQRQPYYRVLLHLWILTQFYPPEVGAAAIRLSRLAASLANAGDQVTVLTSLPNYPSGIIPPSYRGTLFKHERIDEVDVQRVWAYTSPSKRNLARIANQISFTIMAALAGTFMRRPDVLLVESHPLFVCLSGGWLRQIKRAPVVLNVSDLWPDPLLPQVRCVRRAPSSRWQSV